MCPTISIPREQSCLVNMLVSPSISISISAASSKGGNCSSKFKRDVTSTSACCCVLSCTAICRRRERTRVATPAEVIVIAFSCSTPRSRAMEHNRSGGVYSTSASLGSLIFVPKFAASRAKLTANRYKLMRTPPAKASTLDPSTPYVLQMCRRNIISSLVTSLAFIFLFESSVTCRLNISRPSFACAALEASSSCLVSLRASASVRLHHNGTSSSSSSSAVILEVLVDADDDADDDDSVDDLVFPTVLSSSSLIEWVIFVFECSAACLSNEGV
mmetsp:Transcript_25020/g.30269  ORF Transcript_25020/g.30269 Transcript_25020/m.30269 type:complete len:273 (-) Transcript_25020:1028-1846(-)